MICKNCGNEIKKNEKFCSNCGTPVEEKNNLEDTITFGGVEIAKAIIEEENKEAIKEIVPKNIEAEPALETDSNINFEEIKQEMEPVSQEVEESVNTIEPFMSSSVDLATSELPTEEEVTEINSLQTEPIVEEKVNIEESDDLTNTVVMDSQPLASEAPVMEPSVEENIATPVQEVGMPVTEEQVQPVMEQPQSTEGELPFLNSNDVVTDETGIISPVFPFAETPVEAPGDVNMDPNFDRNVNNIPLNNNDSVVDNSTQQLNAIEEPTINNEPDINVNTIEPVSQLEANNIPEETKEEKPKKKTSKLFIGYMVTILVLFIAFMVLFVFTDIGSNLLSNM